MFLSTGRRGLTFGDLAQHYAEHELVDCSESIRPKAHTTIRGYERVLRNRLLPRWGNRIAVGIEPLEVEQWLRSLKKEGDLANPTLGKTRRVNPPKRQPAACRQYACRAIHSGTAPAPFSTAPGHGCMKSLTHIPHCRPAAERLAEVCLPYPQTSSSSPHLGSLLPSTRLCTAAPTPPPPALTTPANFYTPRSLHSICISPASAAPAASF